MSVKNLHCGWPFDDLTQLLQRVALLFPAGRYRVEHGLTEEGDSWFTVDDVDEDLVIFQIMRVDGCYGVAFDAYCEVAATKTIDNRCRSWSFNRIDEKDATNARRLPGDRCALRT
jgi:hypothetical protein